MVISRRDNTGDRELYAIERTAELSAFADCGIVEHAPEFDALAAGGGREVKMPFWKDLTAGRQLLSDSASLTVNKIAAEQDIARIQNDAQVWSVNHLAKVVSGDDPMQAIVDLVGRYWARTDEGLIVDGAEGHVRRSEHGRESPPSSAQPSCPWRHSVSCCSCAAWSCIG